MTFIKYTHIENINNTEVEGIEFGECFIFPKIDGTNGSVWLKDGQIKCASRNRELSLENDNQGFCKYIVQQGNLIQYLLNNPNHRLFGEFLVPHSFKDYRDSAFHKFYIFDVMVNDRYISYDLYEPFLKEYNLEYIPAIVKVTNPHHDTFLYSLEKNNYLVKDGFGVGEGIVIKNYNFINKFGRTCFAKLITSEFKEKHTKEMGVLEIKSKKIIEDEIINKYITRHFCEKVFHKIKNESSWDSKQIPRLLNTVFYDLIIELTWEFLKEHNMPVINFKKLQKICYHKIRNVMNELF